MKHPIHVVYIITKLELGGAQKVCLSLANGVAKHNILSTLISGTQGKLLSCQSLDYNFIALNTLIREISFLSFFNEIRCFFSLYKKLRSLRKKYRHIVVHTHSTKAGLLGRWAAWLAGISIRIHTIHGFAFHQHQSPLMRWIIQTLESLTARITTHFVCVSSEDVKIGLSYLPNFVNKHSIIRAAVDRKQFYIPARRCADFPTIQEPFVFGTIACFKKQKNITDLLQAFAYVHAHASVRLEIIGDGILRAQIERQMQELNIKNAVTLHGWQDTVAPFMLNWHAFVLTSLWEGLPCAIIEARLLKLPVISYRTGGIHDVISHHQNGLLFDQKDWLSLAKGMLTLAQHKQTHLKLSSYTDDLSDFNIEHMVSQHVDLYRSLFHHR